MAKQEDILSTASAQAKVKRKILKGIDARMGNRYKDFNFHLKPAQK